MVLPEAATSALTSAFGHVLSHVIFVVELLLPPWLLLARGA